ncbi:ribonuclease HII [Sneathiella glossodoripedis]|uniref:ribonuclease HII n=1 Tax=Sneathiella glossodoripedis TaxID=418853 RepID=UPI00056CA1FD|nr:ribonuclease HII [Sneathiella glossodoripedis]
MKMTPDFTYEENLIGTVAGVDEVGRGPFAGPVIAAAVILDRDNIPEGLADSKTLSKKKRESLFDQIRNTAQVGLGEASPAEIDELNILQATFLAMQRAVENLPKKPDHLLIDGNRDPQIHSSTQLIVKGDSKSFSISAASIVAKVTRDRKMSVYAERYPHYGWERNSGYGTAEHRKGLLEHGVTPLHRRSFAPIRKMLESS